MASRVYKSFKLPLVVGYYLIIWFCNYVNAETNSAEQSTIFGVWELEEKCKQTIVCDSFIDKKGLHSTKNIDALIEFIMENSDGAPMVCTKRDTTREYKKLLTSSPEYVEIILKEGGTFEYKFQLEVYGGGHWPFTLLGRYTVKNDAITFLLERVVTPCKDTVVAQERIFAECDSFKGCNSIKPYMLFTWSIHKLNKRTLVLTSTDQFKSAQTIKYVFRKRKDTRYSISRE